MNDKGELTIVNDPHGNLDKFIKYNNDNNIPFSMTGLAGMLSSYGNVEPNFLLYWNDNITENEMADLSKAITRLIKAKERLNPN